MGALELYSIFNRLDHGRSGLGTDPSTWTKEDGVPLTDTELAIVRNATPEDAQAVHDLIVLDAKAAGFKLNCGCGGEEPPT